MAFGPIPGRATAKGWVARGAGSQPNAYNSSRPAVVEADRKVTKDGVVVVASPDGDGAADQAQAEATWVRPARSSMRPS
ncbi:hypothetical protein Stsp01_66690 [Streptomyces sp. NBRC 13847]|nr:hypothetical protein Stsp01_66690 [Streptomyces sp. NBRC 13847]